MFLFFHPGLFSVGGADHQHASKLSRYFGYGRARMQCRRGRVFRAVIRVCELSRRLCFYGDHCRASSGRAATPRAIRTWARFLERLLCRGGIGNSTRAFALHTCRQTSFTPGVPIVSTMLLSASLSTQGTTPQANAEVRFTGFEFQYWRLGEQVHSEVTDAVCRPAAPRTASPALTFPLTLQSTCAPTQLAFIRLSSNPAALPTATTPPEATRLLAVD